MNLIADIQGERLDAFLARCVPELTRSGAQRLLEEGCVLRNGKPGKKNDKLNVGDTIDMTVPEPKEVSERSIDSGKWNSFKDVQLVNTPLLIFLNVVGSSNVTLSREVQFSNAL